MEASLHDDLNQVLKNCEWDTHRDVDPLEAKRIVVGTFHGLARFYGLELRKKDNKLFAKGIEITYQDLLPSILKIAIMKGVGDHFIYDELCLSTYNRIRHKQDKMN